MNTPSEPPADPADPVDATRPAASSSGLAAATLRALRAGSQDDEQAAVPSEAPPESVAPGSAAPESDEAGADEPTAVDPEADEPTWVTPLPDTASENVAAVLPARRSFVTAACAIVAVAALVFAVVAGVLWWRAGHSSERRIGIAREQIDKDATIAITTVNTSDYRHPSSALDDWLDASTGSLHAQFSQSRTTATKLLAQAKMVTKANVLDAAVTALDLKKGTATVIASVNVTRTPVTGSVSTVRNRFRASMTRTGGQWKLSNLAVVPVSLS